jgi:hypothetical protein
VRGWIEDIGEQQMIERWNSPDGGRSLTDEAAFDGQHRTGSELVRRFLGLAR